MANGKPRRKSIFGALVLIGIGTLVLLNNLRPGLELWELFSRWWPLLLILWGVTKLFENLAARSAGETPPPTLTGGEIFLLIFLLFIGGAVRTIDGLGVNDDRGIHLELPWFETYRSAEEVKTLKAVADKPLVVTNYRGDVSVQPHDSPEVRVTVSKSVRTSSQERADERMKQLELEIIEGASTIDIKPKIIGSRFRRVRLHLQIQIPRKLAATVSTDNGDIHIQGLDGPVKAETMNGDVEIRDTGGEVNVGVKGGKVTVAGAKGTVKVSGRGGEIDVSDIAGEALIDGEFYGPIAVRNVSKGTHFRSQRTDLTIGQLPGRMEIVHGTLTIEDTSSDINLVTREKDIRMEKISGRLRIVNTRGDIEVSYARPPQGEVDITNQSGGVELILPEDSQFEIHASTRSGDIENSFEDPGLKITQDGNTATLEGKRGTKGPQVRIKTSYGTVLLRKAS